MNEIVPKNVAEVSIDLLESGSVPRAGRRGFPIDAIGLSTEALETYTFADWEPVIYDAMIVAAAVEYADRTLSRPTRGWQRRFEIGIPVHDPVRWDASETKAALTDAVGFLTGDDWDFEFLPRRKTFSPPRRAQLSLSPDTQTVIAYSDGMDSRAVAGLLGEELGHKLVKIRLGTSTPRRRRGRAQPIPFAGVPYELSIDGPNRESTARNRGFKFASIAGIAAYLARASEIAIPESGQGAIGPALVGVAHAYPDYRNHPLFARKMERYFKALFGLDIHFRFPRLWYTKGQTLSAYVTAVKEAQWADTRSCWRGSRWVSIDRVRRQCGVCAACMLRRMSVHAAGLEEAPDTYAATDLTELSLGRAVDPAFRHANKAFSEYAHAGFLHLDHLADMADSAAHVETSVQAAQLAWALNMPVEEAVRRLGALLEQHKAEWEAYMDSLGSRSFLALRRRSLR
ncbi:MAG: 7-cyano-7-deazaguanine synthase [Pseudomonadota bacterium]|nr:7-cyano-7-deazaguanine synthase [Pseudomonadota bacterium]